MYLIVKTRCFYSFTINSQSNLKKFSTLFLRNLPRKTRYEIEQGFHDDLFQSKFSILNFQFSLAIARDRRKSLKKEKEKQKLRKIQLRTINISFTFTFLCRKIYILLEDII